MSEDRPINWAGIVAGLFLVLTGYGLGVWTTYDPTPDSSVARLDTLIAEAIAIRGSLRAEHAAVDSILNTGGCHEIRYYLDR